MLKVRRRQHPLLKRRVTVPSNNTANNVAYGLSQPFINTPSLPIVLDRAPTTSDKAQIGSQWIFGNAYYVLTSITNNAANWQLLESSGGSGNFNAVTATTTVTAGTGITSTTGNITATAGEVVAGTTVTAGTGITATSGNITAATGNVVVTEGDIVASAGSITAGTTLTGTTGISATSGNITAGTGMLVTGAIAVTSLPANTLGISANTVTTQSTGTLSLKSTTANNGSNTGFLQIIIGTTAYYVPYFETINP